MLGLGAVHRNAAASQFLEPPHCLFDGDEVSTEWTGALVDSGHLLAVGGLLLDCGLTQSQVCGNDAGVSDQLAIDIRAHAILLQV